MAQKQKVNNSAWTLTVPEELYRRLHTHHFPGDGDEHGSVIATGIARTERGNRLLARDLFLAVDGKDYVPGKRGYRMLRAEFVGDCIRYCRNERLVYLAIHNHGGTDSVGFSEDDLRSHERGYPALLDIARGKPVGALVLAGRAVAGDIWLPGGERVSLAHTDVVGRKVERLTPVPVKLSAQRDSSYDREARLLGDAGVDLLAKTKVGVIGAGGVGSVLVELLARLGVGHLVVADPDRIEVENLRRLIGATQRDACAWLTERNRPAWVRELGRRFAKPKVKLAARSARRASPRTRFEGTFDDFLKPEVAGKFLDCDYLFLAADTMQVRLLFNAIIHQYLIPGVQIGAKALVQESTGEILQVYSVSRPVTPDVGCLWCNGLIPPGKLQEETQTAAERRAQRYINEPGVIAPSVITLNATAAAQAANDFLFAITGLTLPDASSAYLRFSPRRRDVRLEIPRRDADCPECGVGQRSRRGHGDGVRLPTLFQRGSVTG
jgi:tRNA A37 threonylcarbamoyladenosine dehydratase